MVFCGQCGLQLPPGATTCPRCGSKVEPDGTVAELNPDAPTIASTAYTVPNQAPPYTQQGSPGTQQPAQAPPLVLRPGGDGNAYDYGTQAAYDTRSRAGNPSPWAPTTAMPSATPHPGYTQSGGNYQTQQAFYPPGSAQPGLSGQNPPTPQRSQKGRTTGLIFILLGLLLILSAVVLLALQHNGVIAGGGGNGGSGMTASQTIAQYYDDINRHDYQAAYALWQNPTQNFADFQNGFKNTRQDALAIDNTAVQSDGTVKLTVTVTAKENAAAGSKTTTYKGSYVMGKQSDGTWKIVQGILNAA
ncbi:MAG TPA: zinc-ribbon domain-containing protein [Ktedonosporobacter sp.]|nr:zinc-ribbon domain-containing protein [Ktedonosporobacter sp.]